MALHTIKRGPYEAVIDSKGAQLVSLRFEGYEYLWQGDSRWWTGHAPILFPIVGMLRGDAATSAAGPVSLKRHGIARNYEHAVLSKGQSTVTFELNADEGMLGLYPYPFRLRMTYALSDDGLTQSFEVCNTGDAPMPFVVGGHPAFNVPIPRTQGAFEDYQVRFEDAWTYATPWMDKVNGLIDYGSFTPIVDGEDAWQLDRAPFDHEAIVLEDVPGSTVTLTKDGAHGVTVSFADFKYLGIWSPSDAPLLALEPWVGIATCLDEDDVFEHKRNMQVAEPGETRTYSFTIKPF
ncbi:MAG: aldose 1-epimerase family protein [Coriobacteriaceae bacterium]|nr:aldose 1-epimerase family protein [Coriobacteriaceae bacterium]